MGFDDRGSGAVRLAGRVFFAVVLTRWLPIALFVHTARRPAARSTFYYSIIYHIHYADVLGSMGTYGPPQAQECARERRELDDCEISGRKRIRSLYSGVPPVFRLADLVCRRTPRLDTLCVNIFQIMVLSSGIQGRRLASKSLDLLCGANVPSFTRQCSVRNLVAPHTYRCAAHARTHAVDRGTVRVHQRPSTNELAMRNPYRVAV